MKEAFGNKKQERAAALPRWLRVLGPVLFFTLLNAAGAQLAWQQANGDYLSLQTVSLLACAMLLEYRQAAASQIVYLLLGLAGLPVFAGGGGFSYVLEPSFGYLIAFGPAAYLTAFCLKQTRLKTLKSYLGFGLGALGILYGIGVSYRYFMLNTYWQRSLSMSEILRGLLPLQIPKDILCCLLLAWIFAKRDQLCRKKRWQSEADRERREPSRHLKEE